MVEAELLSASDEAHLKHAKDDCRVIVTKDADFLRLHNHHEHAGIAFIPQAASVGEMIRDLMLIHQLMTAEEMLNHVEFLC